MIKAKQSKIRIERNLLRNVYENSTRNKIYGKWLNAFPLKSKTEKAFALKFLLNIVLMLLGHRLTNQGASILKRKK